MPKYVVQWFYQAGRVGPFEKGEVIELTKVEAEHINRDSPGVLKPFKGQVPENQRGQGKTLEEAQNQMVTKAATRKAKNQQENFGAITKSGFKATKG